jgi:hypothetical protein
MLWARLSSFPRRDRYIDKTAAYSHNIILSGKTWLQEAVAIRVTATCQSTMSPNAVIDMLGVAPAAHKWERRRTAEWRDIRDSNYTIASVASVLFTV